MKGLPNFGNTCYFNSVLQCLLQVPHLSNYFIKNSYDGDSEFIKEYQNFVKTFWLDKKNKIENNSNILKLFKNKFKQFDNFNPQDCQETLFCLIDIFEKVFENLIKDIFYFKIIQETICPSETTRSHEHTSIYMLYPTKGEQLLSDLIKENQKWNTLEGFRDTKEKVHHVATTQSLIWTSPKILIFSIKMYGQKFKTKIEENIILNNFIHKDSEFKKTLLKYNLFATCTHLGSPSGGHYIAYTKHKDVWYLKDDTRCIKINSVPLIDFHYILMYKQI